MTAKEFLETLGYEFPDKNFWMEEPFTEHTFKDVIDLMEHYHKQKSSGIGSKRLTMDEVRAAANDYTEMTQNIKADNILKQKTCDFEAGAFYALGWAACASGGEGKGVSDGFYCGQYEIADGTMCNEQCVSCADKT